MMMVMDGNMKEISHRHLTFQKHHLEKTRTGTHLDGVMKET